MIRGVFYEGMYNEGMYTESLTACLYACMYSKKVVKIMYSASTFGIASYPGYRYLKIVPALYPFFLLSKIISL